MTVFGEDDGTLVSPPSGWQDSARQLLSQAALKGEAASLHQQIEVADERGHTILTVPVGHVTGTDAQT